MSLLDEVKQRADIVQVISKYVDLNTSSRIPKALCPFHSERTPSFVVYPESGTWHCFGSCSTGGDAITFVMKRENIPFRDALRRLADDLGIPATGPGSADQSPTRTRPVSDLYAANEVAAKYFAARLKSPEGEAARKYLEGRGIGMDAAERRGFGLAPSGLETLINHLRAKNVDPRAARDAGLVTRSQDGSWRDMFRGRLTIEIRDAQGRLCGFGARSLDGGEPKYLNTAKSETFDKGRLVYGLHWAADTIHATGRAVVVEGYMDAIAAHEHGFKDVVACMGTAVTPEQLEALSRLVARPVGTGPASALQTGAIVLCLDSDAAGAEATLRELAGSWQTFAVQERRAGVDVRIARPEGGKDPDEAIRSDSAAWRASIDGAQPFIQWMTEAYAARFDSATPQGKAQLFDAIKGPILSVQNTYEQDRYWTLLAKKMGVPEERVRAMLTRPSQPAATPLRTQRGPQGPERLAASQVAAALEAAGEDAIEEYFLALILRHEDLRDFALAAPDEHFRDAANREVFSSWRTSPKSVLAEAPPDDPLSGKIEALKSRTLPPADHLERVEAVDQCVRRLRERHLRYLKAMEEKAFADLGTDSGSPEHEELLRRAMESDSRFRQVFTGPAGTRTGLTKTGHV